MTDAPTPPGWNRFPVSDASATDWVDTLYWKGSSWVVSRERFVFQGGHTEDSDSNSPSRDLFWRPMDAVFLPTGTPADWGIEL